MQKPIAHYVALGRNAACAHKLVKTCGDQPIDRAIAADFFRQLWAALDRETLQDHCDARAAFNEAFCVAYRGLPAPAPAPALPPKQTLKDNPLYTPAPKASASAAACAAFFNAKAGA